MPINMNQIVIPSSDDTYHNRSETIRTRSEIESGNRSEQTSFCGDDANEM